MYCLAIPIWEQLRTLVMSNETHRHVADQFEFTFIADGKRLRLFQGGTEVCRRQQQDLQRDEVYRSSETPAVGQSINQKDGGRRQGPGRGRRCCRTSCGKSQVPGVSQ